MDALLALIEQVLTLIPTVVVASSFNSILIDVLKRVKVIPDGKAGLANLILNGLFWLVFYAAREIGVEAETEEVVRQLGVFAPAVVALIVALFSSKWFHENVAKPIGVSFSHPKVSSMAGAIRG